MYGIRTLVFNRTNTILAETQMNLYFAFCEHVIWSEISDTF